MISPAVLRDIAFEVEPLPSLGDLGHLWQSIDLDGEHSVFLSWPWISTWLKSIPRPQNMLLLRALSGGLTVGLGILTLRRGVIRGGLPVRQAWLNTVGDPAYDCITIEHNGLALREMEFQEVWPHLARWFADGNLHADEFILSGISAAQPARMKNILMVDRREPGYRTPLGDVSKNGLGAILSRNSRQQLSRSVRLYEEEGPLSVASAQDEQTALDYFSMLKELHVRSWTRRGQRNAFSNPFFETFHRTLIRTGIGDGSVDLLRIAVGDRPIGYLYNLRRRKTVYAYQSGFDDVLPQMRPGYVSHALAIERYAADGMQYYDFLGETNRLKRSFGKERYELCWRSARRPTLAFRVQNAARTLAGRRTSSGSSAQHEGP